MLDLDKLQREREGASVDKSDLFDFYHYYFDVLVKEHQTLKSKREEGGEEVKCRSSTTVGTAWWTCTRPR